MNPSIRFSLVSAGVVCLLAGAAAAEKRNVPKMTCEEFVAHSTDVQRRVVADLDGYSKRGKPIEEVDEVDVERDVDVVAVSCREAPRATIWDKLTGKTPSGKARVRASMKCEEFAGYSREVQGEVAYWLAGYHGAEVEGEDVVEIEHDVAVFVEECKNAPKDPAWGRIHHLIK